MRVAFGRLPADWDPASYDCAAKGRGSGPGRWCQCTPFQGEGRCGCPAAIQELRGQLIQQHPYRGLTQTYCRETQGLGVLQWPQGLSPHSHPGSAGLTGVATQKPPKLLGAGPWELSQEEEVVVVGGEQERGTGETRKENLNLWNCTSSRRTCTVRRFRTGRAFSASAPRHPLQIENSLLSCAH